jgi:hypothetical protein
MTKLLDAYRRRRTARRDRSGLGASLGGSGLADAERAYEELQAAFAAPLHLERNSVPHAQNGRRAEDSGAAPRVRDESGGLLGHLFRSTDRSRAQAAFAEPMQ